MRGQAKRPEQLGQRGDVQPTVPGPIDQGRVIGDEMTDGQSVDAGDELADLVLGEALPVAVVPDSGGDSVLASVTHQQVDDDGDVVHVGGAAAGGVVPRDRLACGDGVCDRGDMAFVPGAGGAVENGNPQDHRPGSQSEHVVFGRELASAVVVDRVRGVRGCVGRSGAVEDVVGRDVDQDSAYVEGDPDEGRMPTGAKLDRTADTNELRPPTAAAVAAGRAPAARHRRPAQPWQTTGTAGAGLRVHSTG